MARIKIKDLTKGMEITEEELGQVRAGALPFWRPPWPPEKKCFSYVAPPGYGNVEMCQMVMAQGCGCPG